MKIIRPNEDDTLVEVDLRTSAFTDLLQEAAVAGPASCYLDFGRDQTRLRIRFFVGAEKRGYTSQVSMSSDQLRKLSELVTSYEVEKLREQHPED